MIPYQRPPPYQRPAFRELAGTSEEAPSHHSKNGRGLGRFWRAEKRPISRKRPDQTLDQAFGLPEVLLAVSTSRLSCNRAGKTRTLMSVWDSSGESRNKCMSA